MSEGVRNLDAPFRPRRARWVAVGFAVAQAVVLLALAVAMPGSGPVAWHWSDRAGVVVLAALVAWVLSLFARLRADPGPRGLAVRNVVRRTELEWAQIVAVRFGGGDPWVTLDLDDGDVLAVMAIQRADGDHGAAEARRLATLVAQHTRTDADD
ncbi:MAG TPA: PH domain-containing protein [Kineosporiaceae bacterium]|nr:PH domain-containing protein [Kineosporiaceae bacterium]